MILPPPTRLSPNVTFHIADVADCLPIVKFLKENPPPGRPAPDLNTLERGVRKDLRYCGIYGNHYYFAEENGHIVAVLIVCKHHEEFINAPYLCVYYAHTLANRRRKKLFTQLFALALEAHGCDFASALLQLSDKDAVSAYPRVTFEQADYDLFVLEPSKVASALRCEAATDTHRVGKKRVSISVERATSAHKEWIAVVYLILWQLVLRKKLTHEDIVEIHKGIANALSLDKTAERLPLVTSHFVLKCDGKTCGSIKVFFEHDPFNDRWILWLKRPYIARWARNHSALGLKFFLQVIRDVCTDSSVEVRTFLQRSSSRGEPAQGTRRETDRNVGDARGMLESLGFQLQANAVLVRFPAAKVGGANPS